MHLSQVSDHCYAVINEKNRVCDANSGLINRAGGVVIDTQSDLAHARQMIEMFGTVWSVLPKRVINTHEDADHVSGNQLFTDAEIIGHRSLPERMKLVADPEESQKLLHGVEHLLTRVALKTLHPGVAAIGEQLLEDYNFEGIELVPPTTLFDTRYELDLDGVEAHLIYVREESKKYFEEGMPSLEASKRIEFGPYSEWRAPARLYMNVERAYREFRHEPDDAPWDKAVTFDAIYHLAKAKGISVEF